VDQSHLDAFPALEGAETLQVVAAFDEFRAALQDYIVGCADIESVRDKVVQCVAASHDRAVSMLHYLRTAKRARLIGPQDAQVLADAIKSAIDFADRSPKLGGSRTVKEMRSGELSPGTWISDRYEIVEQVGRGGIGNVFKAIDHHHQQSLRQTRDVAIKVIQSRHADCQEAIRSLQREAVHAQCLIHPNIRRVYGLEREGEHYYLSMEWLDGETLANRLDRTKGQAMSFEAFQNIFSQVTAAIAYAHQHAVIHGDIKPGNVFISTDGVVRLLDFGHTSTGAEPFAVTRGYSSVEVYHGAEPTVSDDVYSLAVMAYRMLAGRRPYGSYTAVQALQNDVRPRRLPQLIPSQWRALRSGLTFHRVNRTRSVESLHRGLFCEPLHLQIPKPTGLVVAA